MKRLTIIAIVMLCLAMAATAGAHPPWARGDRDGRIAYARVMDVRPVFRPVYERRRECRNYQIGVRETAGPDRAAGTVLGAVVGGLLGNTIGKGDGRRAATVAGAVIGGAVGNRVTSANAHDEVQPVYRERCRVRMQPAGREVVAYVVRYRYQGRIYRTRMDHDPGRWMRVQVEDRVYPAE